MKTTFPSRKKEREKVLWYLGHLASISVHLGRMSCASGVVINSGGGLSAPSGGAAMSGKDIFLRQMKTTFPSRKKERE